MPDLGNRHDCYNCGAKFYDLGRPEPLCPKCGANQKDAKRDATAEVVATRRRKKDEVARAVPEEEGEDLLPEDAGDFADEELVAPEAGDDEEVDDVDDDDE